MRAPQPSDADLKFPLPPGACSSAHGVNLGQQKPKRHGDSSEWVG